MQLDLFPVKNTYRKDIEGETKKCIRCNITKSVNSFEFREKNKSRRSKCKACRQKESDTVSSLLSIHPKPNDTNYRCPICNKKEKDLKSSGRWQDRSVWVLDHCHTTESFRGWICNNCNMGLGRFYDNKEYLKKAIQYLESSK